MFKRIKAWFIQYRRKKYAEIQDAICEATNVESKDNVTIEDAICELTK